MLCTKLGKEASRRAHDRREQLQIQGEGGQAQGTSRGLAAFGRNQMVFKENGVAFHYGDGANKHRPVEKGTP